MTAPNYPPGPECETCEGTGRIVSIARVAGEAFDADIIETPCDDCGGEVDPVCPGCEGELDNGWCAACEASWVMERGQLTECHGDPLLKRRVA